MPIYPSSGGFIGSLLRTIQEERSKAPHVLPPAAEPQAPVRAAIQAPLEAPIAPESPGSARVISIRPEGAPPTAVATPPGQVVPPRALVGGIGGPEGRITPPVRSEQSPQPAAEAQPQTTETQPQAAAAVSQRPGGAPRNEPSPAGTKLFRDIAGRTGTFASPAPTPTPTPTPSQPARVVQIPMRGAPGREISEAELSRAASPGLFQRLSSGVQTKAKSASGKIKGLFQRLF